MSTQLHSIRRMGLLASIGLLLVAAVVTLWRLQWQPAPSAAPGLAVHPSAAASDQILIANQFASVLPSASEQPSNANTTAILFLIDESGGVSGRCDDVDSRLVFVTDSEGRRYELVRFYLQLWRAYYQFLQDEGLRDSVARPISLGIVQFAKRDQPVVFMPITPIEGLLNEQGSERFRELQSQDDMLGRDRLDADWFCWTDFPSALDGAVEKLNKSEANKKVLVLLTDGSTRGNEREPETVGDRSTTRERIEDALKKVKGSNIELLTVIWRGNECREENTCGLSESSSRLDGEFEQRKDDLSRWDNWEKQGLLTRIDDKQAIKALAETSSLSPLLPGVGQYATGWIDGATNQQSKSFFSEVARLLKVIVVTSDAINLTDIHFRPQSISGTIPTPTNFAELQFGRHEDQWYSAEKDIPGSSPACLQRALQISISRPAGSRPVLAYYWLPFEQDWPKIASVSVEPKAITIQRLVAGVIPAEDRTIKVNVQMEPIDINHHNCFLAQVVVAGETFSKTLPTNDSALIFPDIILPDDIAHGQTAITAQLRFKNAPEVLAGIEKSTELNVVYKPVFPSTVDISSSLAATTSNAITVTIPVTFANRIPGFEPQFYGLFPKPFDPSKEDPPPAVTLPSTGTSDEPNCPITQPFDKTSLEPVALTASPTSRFVTNYILPVPRHGIERCGYRFLVARWTDSDESISLTSKGPEPPPPPPPLPWIWLVILLVVGVVLVVVIFLKKPWRRKPG